MTDNKSQDLQDTLAAWFAIGEQRRRNDAINGTESRTQEDIRRDIKTGAAFPGDHLSFK